MKKLMIVAAIVCAAVASQAASFTWKTAKSQNVNPAEGTTMAASTAYLFESTAAETILAAFAAGSDWTAGALDSTSITSAGKIAETSSAFTYGGAGSAATINAIFAFSENIEGTDYLYISSVATADGPGTGSATISFSEKAVSSAIKDPGAYAGAGWYGAVPEPTSGLLLLLGMAGLALKRRRA